MASEIVCESSLDYITYLGVSMNAMRLRNKFIDTVLICGKKRFSAHRLVLSCRSQFFREILIKDVKTHKDKVSVVDIEDVDAHIMEALLEFTYLGIVNNMSEIPPSDFAKLLTAADALKINGAVSYFAYIWLHHRTPESIAIIWKWANETGDKAVEQDVIIYIVNHIHQMSGRYEFLWLNEYQMTAVLSHPKMAERDPQDDVMAAVFSWMEMNPKNRQKYFQNFLSFIAIHKLSEDYVEYLLTSEPLMRLAPEFKSKALKCFNFSKKATKFSPRFAMELTGSGDQSEPPTEFALSSVRSNIDVPMQDISNTTVTRSLSVIASTTKKTEDMRSSLNKTLNVSPTSSCIHSPSYYTQWQLLQQQVRVSCASLMFDFRQAINIVETHTIMVVGRDEMNRLVVHLYIPEKKTWSLSHEIKIFPDRDQMAFAYYQGKLFAIGGIDMFQRLQPDVNIFDIMTQTVKEGPSMRVCRTKASVGCDGRIAYLIGGLNRFDNWMTHVECLDMGAEVWRLIPPMKEKRQTPGVAAVNGELFIVSGFTNSCEKYDPFSELWKEVIPMPDFFNQTTVFCCEYEGRLYAFRYFKPDLVCCLDVNKNVWTVFRSMGGPPEKIVCMVNIAHEFWTMDHSGRLFVYDALINFWATSFVCPKSLTRPMKLFAINVRELIEADKDDGTNIGGKSTVTL